MTQNNWSLRLHTVTPHGTIAHDSFGNGPPLVMIHGTPFSSYVWRHLAHELSQHFTIYVYDLLGYGQSDMPDGDVSLGIQSAVLATLLKTWGLTQPTVIAHDFGGATALRAHFLEGCDYTRLLLIDPVAIAPWGSPFVQHVRRHMAAFNDMPAYIHAAILGAYIQDAAYQKLPDDVLAAYQAPWQGPVGQPAFYRQIAQMDQCYTDAVEPRYGEMRCPVHLFWGEQDGWIPLTQGRKLHTMIPNASLTVIENAAHLVQEDQPVALAAALRDALGQG